jgi:hypothetical protein
MGLYPAPVLRRIEPAALRYVETVRGALGRYDVSQRPGELPR